MHFTRIRQLFGFFLFVISLAILTYAIWPVKWENREVPFSAQELSQGVPPGSSAGCCFPEARRLRLDWPTSLQAGGTQAVRLVLEVQPAGEGLVGAKSIYDAYNILAEARLELPGVQVAPLGDISQPMQQGRPVEFAWRVRPETKGEYQGQVWLYLVFIPHGSGDVQRQLLSVQDFSLRAGKLPGLSLAAAQVIGVVGIVIGGVLCLDAVIALVKKVDHKS